MSEPSRATDIVEQNTSQALMAGIVAIICLILGIVFVAYGTLAIAGYLLIGIAVGCLGFAVVRIVQNKQIPVEKLTCPYCQFSNALTGKPEKDVMCRSCQRMIPIENGIVLPTYRIKCEHCQTENFFSKRSLKLICEDCGKEINLDSVRQMLH